MFKYILTILAILFVNLNFNESKIILPAYDVVYRNITFTIKNKLWINEDDNKEICSWGKHKFAVNEIYKPIGQCMTATCIEPGKVEILDCGSVAFDEICTSIGMDMSKRHPNCCHHIACTDNYGNKFIYNPLTPGEGDLPN